MHLSKKDGTFLCVKKEKIKSHIKADGTVLESGKEAQDALYSSLNEKNKAVKELKMILILKHVGQSYPSDSV